MIDIEIINKHLSEYGSFSVIDVLLSEGYLSLHNYELWRQGKITYIDEHIDYSFDQLKEIFCSSNSVMKALKLTASEHNFYRMHEHGQNAIKASAFADINTLLTQKWERENDHPQMDLFMDNQAQHVEDDLVQAIAHNKIMEAQKLLNELSKLRNSHPDLGKYQDLIYYAQHREDNPKIETEYLGAELNGLEDEVEPIAHQLLGARSRDYLIHAWRRISNSMDKLAYEPQYPKVHKSYCAQKILDHQAVIDAVEGEPDFLNHIVLLERLSNSYFSLKQQDRAILYSVIMLQVDPQYTKAWLDQTNNAHLNLLWDEFCDLADEKGWGSKFFDVYLLIHKPQLKLLVKPYLERLSKPLVALWTLMDVQEQQENDVEARAALHALNPELLHYYLDFKLNTA